MKIIYTSKNEEIYVDDDDYELMNKYLWRISGDGYATRTVQSANGKKVCMRMHREIMSTPNGMVVDHINHIRCDNRKENLRVCSQSENLMNKRKSDKNTSGVTGVSWHKPLEKWRAAIKVKGRKKHLGYFVLFDDAVKARKEAEKIYFGEFMYNQKMDRAI